MWINLNISHKTWPSIFKKKNHISIGNSLPNLGAKVTIGGLLELLMFLIFAFFSLHTEKIETNVHNQVNVSNLSLPGSSLTALKFKAVRTNR